MLLHGRALPSPTGKMSCYCFIDPFTNFETCGCTPYPVFASDEPLPPGMVEFPTPSSYGRVSLFPGQDCPPNSIAQESARTGAKQCLFAWNWNLGSEYPLPMTYYPFGPDQGSMPSPQTPPVSF